MTDEARRFPRTTPSASVISRGVLWKLGSQATIQLTSLGVSLGVARLLAPSEYGAASLALAFAAFAVIFSDLTLGAALVQRRIVEQAEASSLMWFSLGLGLVVTAAFALLAPTFAALVGNSDVEPLLLGIAPVFVLSTAGTVPTALLNRRMQFRTLEIRMMVATSIGAASALVIALVGGGSFALVGQQLVQVALLTLLAWTGARWLPSFTVSRNRLGRVAPFGLYVLASRTFSTIGSNVDTLLIGRYLGTAALGPYAIAYNILLIPLTRLAGPIREITFPAFSSLDDHAAIGRFWLRTNRALFAVLAPILAALSVEATDFVNFFLGRTWADAAPVLRLLAIGGLLQVLFTLISSVLQSCGRQHLLFSFNGIRAGVLVIAFVLGLRWGVNGVAAGFAIGEAVMMPVGVLAACRATGEKASAVAQSLKPVLVALALMSGVMIVLRTMTGLHGLPALVVVPVIGTLVFVAFLLWQADDLRDDLGVLARSLRRPPEALRAQQTAASQPDGKG